MSYIERRLKSEWANAGQGLVPFPHPKALISVSAREVRSSNGKYIAFIMNDRVGLAHHPAVREAAAGAALEIGVGLPSPFLGGYLEIQAQLEAGLADYFGYEAGIVFNSGYMANIGAIPALAGAGDFLAIDRYAHACVQDGYFLSRAHRQRFAHNDPSDLESLLSQLMPSQASLVCVDGVYSMSGTVAPLKQLGEVCDRFGACLFVDDSHGMFAVGDRGLGSVAVQNCREHVPILMGTFNKGLGSLGGFVLGSTEVVHHLRSSAKSYRFTASPSPPQTVAAMKSLQIMKEEPERFAVLQSRVRSLRTGLRSIGIDAENNEVPVIPVYFETHEATARACDLALERGVVLYRAGYPATPRNVSMIRLAVTSEHTEDDIEVLLTILRDAKKLGFEPKGAVAW